MSFEFPAEEYLRRLGMASVPGPDEAGLHALHQAQCRTVPFENIEPLLGRGVSLEPAQLAEKILKRRRGGYCFELNAFFLLALEHFGFRARPILGRVFMGRPQAGPRSHQASLVEIDGKTWLADVGFGGPGLVDAIPFEAGFEGRQHGRRIRLRKDPEWGMAYEDEFEGSWRLIYALPEERAEPVDFKVGNHFCSTHPESIFTNNLFCAFPGAEGRITAWNRAVHIFRGDRKEEKVMSSVADLRWLLCDQLRMPLAEADLEALHRKLPAP